ncbi:MAG: sugar transferase [Campylobacterota bacterium]|nr:sugar transferase [Campylobacterota bacterium]
MRKLTSLTILILTDSLALYGALYLGHLTRLYLEKTTLFSGYQGDLERFYLSGLLFLLFILINFALGLYTKRNDFWEELRRSYMAAFLLLIATVMTLFVTKSTEEFSRTLYILMFFNLLWIVPLTRLTCKKLLHQFGLWHINAYLVGNIDQIKKLQYDLRINWYLGYRSVTSIKKAKIVFIATREMSISKLETLIHRYKKQVQEVILIPFLHNISFANAEIIDLRIGRMSFINIQNQLFIRKNIFIKKTAEFFMILLLLPFILLTLLFITFIIKLDSRGAVFFKQKRLGRDGKIFSCYKFRTMHVDNEHLLESHLKAHPEEIENYAKYHKYENDPRITGAGKWLRRFSLDELPQIINVFRFEMNLIGPRPYMIHEKKKIGQDLETILHVRPGLTGLWQISGRNDLDFFERTELDVWYIQNWSLWLDFIIFVKTFLVLVTRRGAK